MSVIVTGSARGIGKAVAEKFLSEGESVVGIDLASSAIEHPLYTHIRSDLTKNLPDVPTDVSVLICCHGVQEPEEDCVAINLLSTIKAVEKYAFTPAIKAVLVVASASARNGSEFPYYVASKAGVVGYVKNVALRLAPYGAVANTLSPGGVLTESNSSVLDDPDLRAEAIGESLLRKWATPEEIAEWAYFLTVKNRSMTGEDILVDNGEQLKSNFVWKK
ncbi:MAG: SDR family oxidoreductase [Clostridia bacterium]|nr:SDR family oxidoreductase [Clostridia bacterium]